MSYAMAGTYAYKKRLQNAWDDWIQSMSETYMAMTTTVVFTATGDRPNETKWSDVYKHKFLWKINKQISRSAKKLLFYGDHFRYEFGEKSLYKTLGDGRTPHHVHGIILVPMEHVGKIWNEEKNQITDRLTKDLGTVKIISSAKIEPPRKESMAAWLGYMDKGKNPYLH